MISIYSDREKASFHKSVYELPQLCLFLSQTCTAHLLTYRILLEPSVKTVKADEVQEMFCFVLIFFLTELFLAHFGKKSHYHVS